VTRARFGLPASGQDASVSRKLSSLNGKDEIREPRLFPLTSELVGETETVVVRVGYRPTFYHV